MKTTWKVILSAVIAGAMLTAAAFAASFSDMPQANYWSAEALAAAVSNGLLQGDNGLLRPQASLTRAEMAAIVNRAFGATAVASLSDYNDVPSGIWYENEMAKAVAMQTFKGYAHQLLPTATITREETFTVLARALGLSDGDTSVLASYADGSSVDGWAADAMASLVEAGYVEGENGRLYPKEIITREEFAQVIYNMCKNYVTEGGTYSEDYKGNVIVRVPNITLTGLDVKGDLILGDGVGDGDVTLQDVTITGRLVVRGGGENSVKLLGNTTAGSIVTSKTSGNVRIYNGNTNWKPRLFVKSCKEGAEVIVEGPFGILEVTANGVTVNAVNATIVSANVTGEKSKIIYGQNSTGGSSSSSSNSSTYTLTLTITDDSSPVRSETTTSRYNTSSSSLLGAIASAASTNEAALDATFTDESTLYAILHEGLTAYKGDDTIWNAFVDKYKNQVTSGTGTDKSIFLDRNSTLASLTINTNYTLSYTDGGKTYTLTVKVSRT